MYRLWLLSRCNSSEKNRNLIHKLQKRAARIITKQFDYSVSSTVLFRELKWQLFENRRDYFLSILAYKCIYGLAPSRLCDEIEMYFERHGINTRNYDSLNAVLPKPNSEIFKQSSKYAAVKVWNSLPTTTQNIQSLQSFKRIYKAAFF